MAARQRPPGDVVAAGEPTAACWPLKPHFSLSTTIMTTYRSLRQKELWERAILELRVFDVRKEDIPAYPWHTRCVLGLELRQRHVPGRSLK